MNKPLVQVRDLLVVRGGLTVLDIPAFDVPRGQVTAIVGPNGVGKSSLLLAIGTLIPIARGVVIYDGQEIGTAIARDQVRRRLAAVFQEPLLLNQSVFDNAALGLRLRRVPSRETRARVMDQLEALGIADLASRAARTLSGGEAQRTSLARALAVSPELLILDEPFAALDAPTRAQLRHDFRSLQRGLGITTLLVTHDLGEAYFLADQIAVMDQGRILQLDQPERLFNEPSSARVAQLVGIKNTLPGTVVSQTCVRIGHREVPSPEHELPAGTRVTICIRADRIGLSPEEGRRQAAGSAFAGAVVGELSNGATITYQFRLDGGRFLPDHSHDLVIDVPMYGHGQKSKSIEQGWVATIDASAMHVIAHDPDALSI